MGDLSHSDPRFRDQRRKAVIASPTLVGLEQIEVRRTQQVGAAAGELWDLRLHFLPAGELKLQQDLPAVPQQVTPEHIRIELSERIDPAVRVRRVLASEGNVLVVRVERDPDTSTAAGGDDEGRHEHASSAHLPIYSLELVDLPSVDRFFARALFAFHEGIADYGLPNELPRPRLAAQLPEIDYLSKDYDSFRQLMLERLKREVPSWHEHNPADLGVTLVELLAYAGDYLSYYQDAVATEAYIATARQRISIRRHARLVDYRLHEGANARCWVQIKVAASETGQESSDDAETEAFELPAGTELLTSCGQVPGLVRRGSRGEQKARAARPLVFQTLFPARLHPRHGRIEIYTWGASTYGLRAGATSAALIGHLPHLRSGEVLIFERRHGSGIATGGGGEMAAPQPVRLAHPPRLGKDPTVGEDGEPVAITEIEWLGEDALELDLPVTEMVDGELQRLACVRGNNVLVDHGETRTQILPRVIPGERFAPRLAELGLTHRIPWDDEQTAELPARGMLEQNPRHALPALELYELEPEELERYPDGLPVERLARLGRERWQPRHDLLSSDRFAQDFVVEIDDLGYPNLRFGDDRQGLAPYPETRFQAVYRVGSGPAGNIGAFALRHVVLGDDELEHCDDLELRVVEARNPLAGHGGLNPEDQEQARHYAPQALHSGRLRRCVTEDDYARVAESHPEVEKAVARLHWSGCKWVAFVYVQRPDLRPLDSFAQRRLQRFFTPFLLADSEVEIRTPRFVPLDLCLHVWPTTSTLRANLRRRLRDCIEQGELPFLAPDYFTFGRPLYLSEVITHIMEQPEVGSVEASVFKRWGEPSRGELEQGEIALGPLEIAVLRNDPSAPHLGSVRAEIGELR